MFRVLINIFVTAYFKKYANTFFILFGLLVSYFLFIQTAGDFFEHNQEYWSFLIPLKVVEDPILLTLFILLSIIYIYSCIRFVQQQFIEPNTYFLQVSLKGLSPEREFRYWLIIYSLLFLPIISYGLFVILIGYVLGHSNFTYLVLIVTFLPVPISSYYSLRFHCFKKIESQPPFYSHNNLTAVTVLGIKAVYLLQFNKLLIGLTKGISLLLIYLFLHQFDIRAWDLRTVYLAALCVGMIHTVLIYKELMYESKYMNFVLNFPYRSLERYGQRFFYFFILSLLELLLVFYLTNVQYTIMFAVFLFANMLFLNSLVLRIGNNSMLVIKTLTLFFFISVFLILYNFLWVLTVFISLLSILVYFKNFQYIRYKV